MDEPIREGYIKNFTKKQPQAQKQVAVRVKAY